MSLSPKAKSAGTPRRERRRHRSAAERARRSGGASGIARQTCRFLGAIGTSGSAHSLRARGNSRIAGRSSTSWSARRRHFASSPACRSRPGRAASQLHAIQSRIAVTSMRKWRPASSTAWGNCTTACAFPDAGRNRAYGRGIELAGADLSGPEFHHVARAVNLGPSGRHSMPTSISVSSD